MLVQERGRASRRWLLMGLMAYLFILLYANRGSSIVFAGDSRDYVYSAQKPLFSLGFFNYRPFIVPLIYKALGADPLAIVIFQVVFHAFCWSLLALAVMGWMRNRTMRWTGFAVTLLFSLSIEVSLWNLSVLSESIAHSSAAALTGLVLMALKRAVGREERENISWGWTLLLVVAAFFWSFTRDQNPYVLLCAGSLVGISLLWPRVRQGCPWPRLGVLAAACLGIYFLQTALLAHSERKPWSYAVTTDICQRILPDPAALHFFADAGMPSSPILMKFAGQWNKYEANKYSDAPDPSLIDSRYDSWVEAHGLSIYLRYVVSHPLRVASWVWGARSRLLSPQVRSYGIAPCTLAYQLLDHRRSLMLPLCSKGTINGDVPFTYEASTIFFPLGSSSVLASLLFSLGCAILWMRHRVAALLVPIGLYGAALIQDVVTVVGDANEVDRHAIGAAILIRLALWLSALLIADALLIWWCPEEQSTPPNPSWSRERSPWWTGGFITGAYLLLLLYSYRQSNLVFAGDALDYIQISQDPLLALRFWAYRPFAIPLLYRVFGSNPLAIVFFQVVLHAVCWILLGWSVARWVNHRRLAWTAFASMLAMSLSVEVNLWNPMILSESISNSLTVAFVALVLLYLRGGSVLREPSLNGKGQQWGWPILLMTVGVGWSFLKDSNPYTLLLLAVMVAMASAFRSVRKRLPWPMVLLTGAVFVATFFVQSWLLSRSTRSPWAYAMTTNICQRILPDPSALAAFRDAGMPASPILMQFSGKYTEYSGNKCAAVPDQTKIDPVYDEWVLHHGLRTYIDYVLTHPKKALGWVWKDRHLIFSPSVQTYPLIGPFTIVYDVVGRRRTLAPALCSQGFIAGSTEITSTIGGFFFPLWPSFYLLAIAACLGALALFWQRRRPVELVPLILFIVCAFNAVVINLGDCSEVGRHSITLAILLRVAFWLALFLLGDAMLSHERTVSPAPKSPPSIPSQE